MMRQRRLHSVSLTVVLTVMLIAGLVGSATAAPPATVTEVRGSAFGYHSYDISLFCSQQPCFLQPERGPAPHVELVSDASNSPQTAHASTGRVAYGPAALFTSDDIDVVTLGRTGRAGFVRSHSSIDNINKAVTQPSTGSEMLTADNLTGQCHADASSVTGKTTVTNGTVRTHAQAGDHEEEIIQIPADPPPNYMVEGHLHLGFATDRFVFVFNEQIVNDDGTITVNPVHQYYGYFINEEGEIEEDAFFGGGGSILHGHLILGQVVCGVTAG